MTGTKDILTPSSRPIHRPVFDRDSLPKDLREATVYVVDDDDQVRNSIRLLAHSLQLNSEVYSSAQEFLQHQRMGIPSCLILDVYLPGMNGVELLEKMRQDGRMIPTIMITAYGEVPTAVRAMKAGAIDFVQKPFNREELVDLIHRALIGPHIQRPPDPARVEALQKLASLTDRERDVMQLFFMGENTKRIASQLAISPKTVDYHRWNVLKKMGASNMIELAYLVAAHVNES